MSLPQAIHLSESNHPEKPANDQRLRVNGWVCFLAGLAFILGALIFLEIRQPFYFAQDDSLAGTLGGFKLNCETFLHGDYPAYNPYQFLGAPQMTVGYSCGTYPPLYISYLFAKYVCRNTNTLLDAFCILHILLGYGATWLLARKLGARPSIAALSAVSFSVSGFSLICGRSWCIPEPTTTYLPLCFLFLLGLQEKNVSWKWVVGAGFTLGLYLNSGFAQLFAYAMIFALIWVAVALACGKIVWQRALLCVPVMLIALAMAAPILVSFHQNTSGWHRDVPEGPRLIATNLVNMFLPANISPEITSGLGAMFWGSTNYELVGELYYCSTILVGAALVTGVWGLVFGIASPNRKQAIWDHSWPLLALIALGFCFGTQGPFWPLLAKLPLFDKMEDPFKFIPFFNLFAMMGGALAVERYLNRQSKSLHVECALVAASVLLLCWHVDMSKSTFYTFGDTPYPKMPAQMASLLKTDPYPLRVLSIAPFHSVQKGFFLSLNNDWPTEYRIPAYGGYDPAVAVLSSSVATNQLMSDHPFEMARAYGIKWIVFCTPKPGPNALIYGSERVYTRGNPFYARYVAGHIAAYKYGPVSLFPTEGADPFAFVMGRSKSALPVKLSGAGADVDVSSLDQAQQVVVGLSDRPGIAAALDGKPLKVGTDQWMRIVVTVPAGGHDLTIRMPVAWGLSAKLAAILLAMAAGLAFVLLRTDERKAVSVFDADEQDDEALPIAA